MNKEHWWNYNWQRKIDVLIVKPAPVSFCPQHPTRTTLRLNPGLRDEKLATNHLSYGRVPRCPFSFIKFCGEKGEILQVIWWRHWRINK
jgi:hypothetical protein